MCERMRLGRGAAATGRRGAVSQACKLRLCGSGTSYNAAIIAREKSGYVGAEAIGTRGGGDWPARCG